jgi:hypothetical protein
MSPRAGKKLFPNPFYVLLLLSSTLFVFTIFGYLIVPLLPNRPGAGEGGPAEWLDHHAPTALGVEFLVMLSAGLVAMLTDRWFPERPTTGGK